MEFKPFFLQINNTLFGMLSKAANIFTNRTSKTEKKIQEYTI